MGRKENDRRKFLEKIALGSTALAAIPVLGAFRSSGSSEKNRDMEAIKKIRALGFQWQTQDPFLFCVHHEDDFPEGNAGMGPQASLEGRQIGSDFHIKDGWRMYHGERVPGFPGHPHRGFETLTVVRKGMVDHADSAGGAGRYGNGDLQWMTAGKGLMHSEMFPLLKQEERNPLELFQIWLNLPAKSKMAEPDYKMFWNEEIPHFYHKEGVYIEVMAGELFGEKAPVPPKESWAFDGNNHVGVYVIRMDSNTEFTLPATEEGVNRTLFFYDGKNLRIADKEIPEYHAVDVEPTKDLQIESGENGARILVLQGRPINEPVVQHGPFVMNSRQEIQEAFMEYQRTQFGGWPWSRYDQVHDRKSGRFARYSDGTEEIKG